jgi:hypothetical protein
MAVRAGNGERALPFVIGDVDTSSCVALRVQVDDLAVLAGAIAVGADRVVATVMETSHSGSRRARQMLREIPHPPRKAPRKTRARHRCLREVPHPPSCLASGPRSLSLTAVAAATRRPVGGLLGVRGCGTAGLPAADVGRRLRRALPAFVRT